VSTASSGRTSAPSTRPATRSRRCGTRGRNRRPTTTRPAFGAARYWGVGIDEYYKRADTWPLASGGDILTVIMCEEVKAIKNLPKMLAEVPGIGVVLIGEGDLSQDLGHPREYDYPGLESAIADVVAICNDAGVPAGIPHVTAGNVVKRIDQGFKWLMPNPVPSNAAVDIGRKHIEELAGAQA
jgi:4-hydroxy-2-oxoheptanedioate aldolase